MCWIKILECTYELVGLVLKLVSPLGSVLALIYTFSFTKKKNASEDLEKVIKIVIAVSKKKTKQHTFDFLCLIFSHRFRKIDKKKINKIYGLCELTSYTIDSVVCNCMQPLE